MRAAGGAAPGDGDPVVPAVLHVSVGHPAGPGGADGPGAAHRAVPGHADPARFGRGAQADAAARAPRHDPRTCAVAARGGAGPGAADDGDRRLPGRNGGGLRGAARAARRGPVRPCGRVRVLGGGGHARSGDAGPGAGRGEAGAPGAAGGGAARHHAGAERGADRAGAGGARGPERFGKRCGGGGGPLHPRRRGGGRRDADPRRPGCASRRVRARARHRGGRARADGRLRREGAMIEVASGERSAALFERARRRIPGGVNSPVRAFRAVGGEPFFVGRAAGARLQDVDGREYVDYVLSWGALLLGHADPAVQRAVAEAAARGTSYGAPCALEVELAEAVATLVPSVEMVRFVNSGTEATMSAVRLARAATGRDRVLKFAGCYHGHGDSFLVQAGSGAATLGPPDSPGVPAALAALALSVPFNDGAAVEAVFRERGDEIACVIVEPIVGNAGFIPPVPGFLELLRRVTREHGALLIFDEVMTGFRVAAGGAQERFGIE